MHAAEQPREACLLNQKGTGSIPGNCILSIGYEYGPGPGPVWACTEPDSFTSLFTSLM